MSSAVRRGELGREVRSWGQRAARRVSVPCVAAILAALLVALSAVAFSADALAIPIRVPVGSTAAAHAYDAAIPQGVGEGATAQTPFNYDAIANLGGLGASAAHLATEQRAEPVLPDDRRPAAAGHDGLRLVDDSSAPEALTATQRGRYLLDNWHSATFPNRTQSINYHLARHGNGRTAFEYTRDAQNFFSQNRGLATEVTLRDGTAGLRIQTKVPLTGGGTRNVGGYWTPDGRLVTFWD